MFRYLWILVLICVVKDSYMKGVDEKTQELLLQMTSQETEEDCQDTNEETFGSKGLINTGLKFNCPVSEVKKSATSVHKLRPEDIDVVAAVGDSYTAAYGAGANFLGPLAFREHRGLSFSIGGDETLESHVSLPNILEKYNPDVYGFSEGVGLENSNLNVAVTGATSEDLESMIDGLIDRMENDPNINMKEDWKLISMFIGGNDVFDSCLRPRFTPKNYKSLVEAALNTMKSKIPRALVNIMPVPDVVVLKKLTGVICDTVHLSMCPCLYVGQSQLEKITQLSKEYSAIVEELAQSGEFDTDDFAVVYQPFISGLYVPDNQRGKPDYTYFAPDCLHLSRKGHASGGYHLWANMIEPVHEKNAEWSPNMPEYLPCPKSPYIYTNVNSAAEFNTFGANAHAETDADQPNSHIQDNPNNSKSSSLSGGAIFAIVLFVTIVVLVSGYAIYRYKFRFRLNYQCI